jgi:hypothetical protein
MADVKKRSIDTIENENDDWLGPKQSEAEIFDESIKSNGENLHKKRKSKSHK